MFVDREGKKYPYIFCFEEETNDYLPGWYFSNETEQLEGPFSTLEETLEIQKKYNENL